MKDIELVQRSFPFTRLTLTVLGNQELVLEHRALLRSTRLSFPLGQIAPAPIHHRAIPLGWTLISAIALLALAAAVTAGWYSQGPGELFGLLFVGGIFAACLFNTFRLSSNLLHFKDAGTGAALFAIHRNKPSAEAVDAFVDMLLNRIESFRNPSGVGPEELAFLYKKHLDYLLDNEVLLPEEYDVILQRLEASISRRNVVELVR